MDRVGSDISRGRTGKNALGHWSGGQRVGDQVEQKQGKRVAEDER